MRIGIDLLWVRPSKCGGTESFVRNLLDGFAQYGSNNEYILFVARDNADTFVYYQEFPNLRLHHCSIDCSSQPKRILWENMHLDQEAGREKLDVMYIPVYSMPRTHGSGIPYVCTIHDLQALHYPQYFSWAKRVFLRQAWRYTCNSADVVVASSNFCMEDLKECYPAAQGKVTLVYDPVRTEKTDVPFAILEDKFALEDRGYYYCVSSMLPHKNLVTVLKTMAEMKKACLEQGTVLPKLVVSGVGGQHQEFQQHVNDLEIADIIVQTGFVSNGERDCLYEHCRLFLFPSVFEGFGMPPIEAMRKGKRVVMTRKSCLEEITEGKAVYVEDPYDEMEWLQRIGEAETLPEKEEAFEQYQLKAVVNRYLEVLKGAANVSV